MHQILNRSCCTERQSTCQPRWFKFVLKMQASLPATSPAPTSTSQWVTLGRTPSPWSCAHPGAGSTSTRRGSPRGAPPVPSMWGHNPGQFCCKMQICGSPKLPNLPVEARGSSEATWPWLRCKRGGWKPPVQAASPPKTPCSSSEHIVDPWEYTICGNLQFPNSADGDSLSERSWLHGESRSLPRGAAFWGQTSAAAGERRLAKGLRWFSAG